MWAAPIDGQRITESEIRVPNEPGHPDQEDQPALPDAA